ncbi:MAG: methionyl-tRNA formyltransferase [Porticoccus sp.]|nr:methionyl-tRNA formyltransferase [Porticoccus sp.]
MRIVFAGTPEFAAQHLQALLDNHGRHEVVAVYTQPDRPAGRGKKLTPSPVKTLAENQGLKIHQPLNLKDSEQQRILAELNADLMVVVAYGLLLPPAILNTPKYGCINVHASLLPRWRGAAPIQRALEAGDHESGITIMQMDVGLDTGDMLLTAHCTIDDHDTGGSLHDKLAAIGPPALLATLNKLAEGKAIAEKQDDALNTYAPKISKEEGLLNWELPAELLCRKVRAFNPFPVTYTTLNNERVRVWQAKFDTECTKVAPGTIIEANHQGIRVNTGKGTLLITELQLPGKKRLPVSEILKSRAELFTPSQILGQRVEDPKVEAK